MKAKEYLKQLQSIQAKIDRRFEETGMLRSMLESTTSPFGKDYLSKTSNQDKFANIIAKNFLIIISSLIFLIKL